MHLISDLCQLRQQYVVLSAHITDCVVFFVCVEK